MNETDYNELETLCHQIAFDISADCMEIRAERYRNSYRPDFIDGFLERLDQQAERLDALRGILTRLKSAVSTGTN